MARHLWTSLQYFNNWSNHSINALLNQYFYYPPLIYWVSIPVYLIFGASVSSAVLVSNLFLPILVFSTYGIGRRLWGRLVGLSSAIVVMSYPIVTSQFKEYQLDAPLMAMVALAVLALILAREFSIKWMSMAFGVVFGLGMLTKWTFIVAIAAPLAMALIIMSLRVYKTRNYRPLQYVFVAGLIAYTIASIWYLPNQVQLRIDMSSNGVAQALAEGDPIPGSFNAYSWYAATLLNVQVYLLPILLFFVGITQSIAHRKSFTINKYLWATLIGCYIGFSYLPNKDARYTMVLLPALAVLSVYWIHYLKNRIKLTAAMAIMLVSLLMYFTFSFGLPLAPKQISLNRPNVTLFAQHGYIIGAPTNELWHQEEIFKSVAGKSLSINYSGPESIWFNNWGIAYYSNLYHVALVSDSRKADRVAIRSSSTVVAPDGFLEKHIYCLPDGTNLYIYQK